MKRRTFNDSHTHTEAPEPQGNPLQCYANGCPLFGTVSNGSTGRYLCSCHQGAHTDEWARITSALRRHDWLIELAANVRNAATDKHWVPLAMQFWQGEDPYMQPTPSEQQRKGNYLWRLWAELEYRAGCRKQRPQPIEPKPMKAGRVIDGWKGVGSSASPDHPARARETEAA